MACPISLEGKVALVIGGSGGIGQAAGRRGRGKMLRLHEKAPKQQGG
jgi:hypothetical protein